VENSYRFFRNNSCKYFPCHQLPQEVEFNCLFCYCPLYALGEDCEGLFTHTDDGLKCCAQCHLPHLPDYYDTIINKLGELACPPDAKPQEPYKT